MLLGARQFFERRGAPTPSVPTARDYVQDGLIAMWDGIENAGWGVHDLNFQGWTNLVTGEVRPFVNSVGAFGTNCFKSGDGGGVNLGLFDGLYTLEICLARHGGSYAITSPDYWAEQNASSPINMIYVNNVGYVPNRANAGNRVSFDDYAKPHTVSFVRLSSGDKSCITYGDGNVSTGNLYNDYWTVTKGYLAYAEYHSRWSNIDCYCHRLYSRALTAAEVAANYAIDKARFNLP